MGLDPTIAAAIARGATVLTPNQRAARAIRQAFDQSQRSAGLSLWTPAKALPLESWLASLWHQRLVEGLETRILLNRSQEQFLWRDIIASDPEARQTLRSPDALSDMAARAWSLAHLYNAFDRIRDFAPSTDSHAFDRWSRAFDRRLTRSQYITAAQLPTALASPRHLPSDPLLLVDFETHPPAIATLLDQVPAEWFRTNLDPASSSLYTAEDDHDELLAAAHWIRSHRQAHPQARIAVVVPNLAERRAQIDRTFAPILSPESLPITASASPPVYEFSLGRPLAELSITISALDLLQWPLKPLPLESISALLLSPWLVGADLPSSSAAAEFDAYELRQTSLLRPDLSLEATIRLLNGSPRRDALAALLHRLRSLNKAARDAQLTPKPGQPEPHLQPFAAWSDTFRTLLAAASWTAHARADSHSFQQHRRWESALDELATLDFEARRVDAPEAITALTRILRQTVFAPESVNAPVQILGPLELGGIAFDALWFLGADDIAWPAPITTSPLLPWQLQRALAIPGADRDRDAARAQALTVRIAHSASEVVFSYARHSEEGDRRPSPLLAQLDLAGLASPTRPSSPPPEAFDVVPEDTTLPPPPLDRVRGGAHILKLQAACAFRAFAEHRLWSSEPESREPGLSHLERGILVHDVMQLFWTDLQSQAALKALPLEARADLLDRSIDAALAAAKASPETAWDDAYLGVQRRRLRDLLSPWLDLEAARPSFHVQVSEEKKHFQLGPLALSLRIDRIDQVDSGLVILDYKTGDARPSQWLTDRPEEPQLPLYALLAHDSGEPLAGVAFALLRAGQGLGLNGFADDPSVFGKSARMDADTLAGQVAKWRFILTDLAEAYAAGDTRVAPRSYPTTCQRCTQRMLCRLDPTALDDLDDDDDDESGPTVE